MFSLFVKYHHPLFSIFYVFDIEYKRLTRFILFFINLSSWTLIIAIIFGDSYRPNAYDPTSDDYRDGDSLDTKDQKMCLLLGVFFGFLMLPYP